MSLTIRPPLQRSGTQAGLRLPAETWALWNELAVPWLAIAALALGAGLFWRFGAGTVQATAPSLRDVLDWAGLGLWLTGSLVLAALEVMQACRQRGGIVPAPPLALALCLRQAPAILIAAGLLALSGVGLLCAYRAGSEALAFRDAELRLFSVTLAPAFVLALLLGGAVMALLSALLLCLMRRCLPGNLALAIWIVLSLGLVALQLQTGPAQGVKLLPGLLPGALLADFLETAAAASAEYVYYLELLQMQLLRSLAWLALGLLLAFSLACLTLRRPPAARSPVPAPHELAAWAAALLPALLAFPDWWVNAGRPGNTSQIGIEALCSAALVAGWAAYSLAAVLPSDHTARRAGFADWGRLFAPSLVWSICALPLVQSAVRSRAEVLAASATALAVWLAGLVVIRAIQGRAAALSRLRAAVLGINIALLALPLWQGQSLPFLSVSATMAMVADRRAWEAWAACGAVFIAALAAAWLLERRPKVRQRRADTTG